MIAMSSGKCFSAYSRMANSRIAALLTPDFAAVLVSKSWAQSDKANLALAFLIAAPACWNKPHYKPFTALFKPLTGPLAAPFPAFSDPIGGRTR